MPSAVSLRLIGDVLSYVEAAKDLIDLKAFLPARCTGVSVRRVIFHLIRYSQKP